MILGFTIALCIPRAAYHVLGSRESSPIHVPLELDPFCSGTLGRTMQREESNHSIYRSDSSISSVIVLEELLQLWPICQLTGSGQSGCQRDQHCDLLFCFLTDYYLHLLFIVATIF